MTFLMQKDGAESLKFCMGMEIGCNFLYFNAAFLKQKEQN